MADFPRAPKERTDPAIGALATSDGVRRPRGWFDIVDYGAVGDGVTDNTVAIAATIEAASQGTGYGASTVYVPTGNYYCADNVEVSRQTQIVGCGTGADYGPSQVTFAALKGFIFHSVASSPVSSDSTYSEVARLRITCTSTTLPVWQSAHAYVEGDKVRVANDNRYYWECTVAGTSGGSVPFHDEVESMSGAGKQLFLVVVDGGVTWECKAACGIQAYRQIKVLDCHIEDATNAGIMFFGSSLTTPATNCNGSFVERCRILNCGVGIHVYGGNANNCAVRDTNVQASGSHHPGTGGFGFIDAAFLGMFWENCNSDANTGKPYFSAAGVLGLSTFNSCYSEGGQPTSKIIGLSMGGVHGTAYDTAQFVTGFYTLGDYWQRIWSKFSASDAVPQLRFDDVTTYSFMTRYTTWDSGHAPLADTYNYDGPSAWRNGWWITGHTGSLTRPLIGFAMCHADEGVGHYRNFWGEFRGDGAAPYFIAYCVSAKTDQTLRVGIGQGVGGHFVAGDRYEPAGDGTAIGEVCTTDGWAPAAVWAINSTCTVYDAFSHGGGSTMVKPSTPNGYAYVCTKSGASHAATEPTWPTTFLRSGGICPYKWHAAMRRRIGDYGGPIVRNGHYYKVAATASPDTNGYAAADIVEPTWPTGGGSTVVDGALTWTEQGSDVGTYVTDNTTEWQCVGPEPIWSAYPGETHESEDAACTEAPGASDTSVISLRHDATTADDTAPVTLLDLTSRVVVAAASGKNDVYNVSVLILGGGASGHVSAKLEGTYIVDDAGNITRLGTVTASTPVGSGDAGDIVFDLEDDAEDDTLEVVITDFGVIDEAMKWSVIVQIARAANTTEE